MKITAIVSVCALLAASSPAWAQSAAGGSEKSLQQNGSPNGAGMTHAKQPAASGTEAGPAPTEGRSSSDDANAPGQNGTDKMKAGETAK